MVILGLAFLIIVFFVLVLIGIVPGLRKGTGDKITLTVWGPLKDGNTISALAADYRKISPKVDVKYRQFDPATYENDLLNALASSNAPDIIMFHNTWLPKHADKVLPANEEQISFEKFKNLFPTVAQQDFAPDNAVYALPLYIDTLALLYNEDIFDNKGLVAPPENWEELQNPIAKLREIDKSGKLVKAVAAIGGSDESVNRATDLLNLIMLQAGTKMVDDKFTAAVFNSPAGLEALEFYTKFSNKSHPFYAWDENFGYSVDEFANGRVGMIFDYAQQRDFLKEKNPFLRFRAAMMPQPKDAQQNINFANYWGMAVANKSQNPAAAWEFMLYLSADQNAAFKYLQLTKRPPALRNLINANLTNLDYGVFAKQALTARSWPQIDNAAVENSFSKMIKSVIGAQLGSDQALERAEHEITQLMQKRIR